MDDVIVDAIARVEDALAGKTHPLEVVRWLRSPGRLPLILGEHDPLALEITGIDSETDVFDIDDEQRALWNPEALARKDAELAAYLKACDDFRSTLEPILTRLRAAAGIDDVEAVRDAELARIANAALVAALRARLVPTRPCQLEWDYGEPGEMYRAFVIAELPERRTAIAFSRHGFGPRDPWGVISLDRLASGPDACWFISLEDAFYATGLCPVPPPPGYEVG